MKPIISTDTIKLSHTPEKIFRIISDVTTYEKWWRKNVKVKVLESAENHIGSKVEIRASGGWFRCEIVSLDPPREIRIKYYDGVQKGEGIWIIEQTGDTITSLTYSINLVPVGIIPRLLSNILNFSKIHSKQMKGIFANLNDYLNTI